jgi:uncharacterized protein CbrC (UPF0167 family)
MPYKYFAHPNSLAAFHDEPMTCEICATSKKCLDASSFYGEKEMDAICEDCLAGGRLKEINACTMDADVEMLVQQLERLHPEWKIDHLLQDAKAKTDELELRTPPVLSWQEWKYPAADGDYCKFMCFASKADYIKLAGEDGDPKAFFASTLYDTFAEDTNIDGVWDAMPDTRIKTVAKSNEYFLLVYLFKSLHSDTYVSLWDIC